jgi:diguanylate cyclase (GGDEF)-like protein/PAS domain S-box-containing protein
VIQTRLPTAAGPGTGEPILLSLRLYCRASIVVVSGIASVVLYGWAFHVVRLTTVLPGLVTMKANTAAGLILLSASLGFLLAPEPSRRRVVLASCLAAIAAILGAASFSQYVWGVNLHIDELLVRDLAGSVGTSSPGRMAPTTALAFVELGLALLLLNGKGRRLSQLLSLAAALIAMLALTGYAFHATALYRIMLFTQVALHTAVALALLSAAVFFACPRSSIAGVLTGDGSGSVVTRRLLPAVLVVPLVLGWILLEGQNAGLYGTEMAVALFATSSVVIFAFLVWLSAAKTNEEYEGRNQAEIDLRQLNQELEGRVAERTKALEEQTRVLAEQAALLDLAQDSIVVRDMDRRIVFWSKGAEAMTGWPAELATGKLIHDLVQTDFSESLEEIEAHLLREGYWEGEAVLHRRDGTKVVVASRRALQRGADGAPFRILSVSNDITARKVTEGRLQALTDRLSLATAVAKIGVWDWNLKDNTLTWDDTMFSIYGLSPVVPMPYERWASAVFPEDLPAVEEVLGRAISEKSQGFAEFRIVRANGSTGVVSVAESVALDEHGNVSRVIGVNVDITERRIAEESLRERDEQLTHLSEHDFLTGLPNRMLLNDRIRQAVALAPRHRKHVAVLFLDLDGFKEINDRKGHATGDRLLQSVARRLVECVRASDTVCRRGGDEFVVLLSESAHAEDAGMIAQKILTAVADPHWIDQAQISVTTSIGVSVFPQDGSDPETLIQNADTAMYQAKESGGRAFRFFESDMNIRATRRRSLEEDLAEALERREFSLQYQPKIDLKKGTIAGAEAFIRWSHPGRGPVPPAEFLPAAEACGVIVPIGRWVLREACRQVRAWEAEGFPGLTVSVNVSGAELQAPDFLEAVCATLDASGLDPGALELDLTESVLNTNSESASGVVQALRKRGMGVAIDDFGTGYWSLSYLREFPVDTLKIDQSLVRQINASGRDSAIVAAVINLARSLDLRIIAEGVETLEESSFLQAHGCDMAQGYYFSRPLGPEKFARLLERGLSEWRAGGWDAEAVEETAPGGALCP